MNKIALSGKEPSEKKGKVLQEDFASCKGNELLVVFRDCDRDYLKSYISEKTKQREASRDDCGGLIWERYPLPDEDAYSFSLFMDRPYEAAVRSRHEFRGVFAVDVSGYAGLEEDRRFRALVDYMEDHPGIVFSLILKTDNRALADRMAAVLKERIGLQTKHLHGNGVGSPSRQFGL